ncbi:MAG: hypothetical protein D6784_01470 [Chloroflexi bacterium]|nr:MAG: hypothetical protein D6784_01470 [Chloroflexota bacterium]
MSQRVYLVSQQLIANNLEFISASSWRGYQHHGRGFLLIDGGPDVGGLDAAASPMIYVPAAEIQEADDAWNPEDLKRLVNSYHPEQEVIVVVRWRGELGMYRLKPPTAPPEAYQRLKAVVEK